MVVKKTEENKQEENKEPTKQPTSVTIPETSPEAGTEVRTVSVEPVTEQPVAPSLPDPPLDHAAILRREALLREAEQERLAKEDDERYPSYEGHAGWTVQHVERRGSERKDSDNTNNQERDTLRDEEHTRD
jgi:hypothetical protein